MTTCPVPQDLPPPGGYRPINCCRNPAKTLFKGPTLILGYLGITAGSCFLYYLNCKKVHREELERRSAELALYPLLLAERDRAYLKQLRRNRDAERELMKNVEGWKVGTYYGEPIYRTLPKDKLIEPRFGEYYVHSSNKDITKRAHLVYWS
ncbi:hypothetical protein RN001_005036 [Aquatica leii]|uniref:NADH dehydrogenase [ubiquinone] 1 alpha subcomplex subunit 13 n=1 Tax=Aquatica leii TaxID=1421715 RepID=A0AAN7SHQ6_9COLE|nr:hypothetical protein RN001_005036 [Aquatica leii]